MSGRNSLENKIRQSIARAVAPIIAKHIPEADIIIDCTSTRHANLSTRASDTDVVIVGGERLPGNTTANNRVKDSLKRIGLKPGIRGVKSIHITAVPRWIWDSTDPETLGNFLREVKRAGRVLLHK